MVEKQKRFSEEFPLLSAGKSPPPDVGDPEDPSNKVGDKCCYALFVVISIVLLGAGITVYIFGDINAILVGVDDNGFVCGSYRRPLGSWSAQTNGASSNLAWSRSLSINFYDYGNKTAYYVNLSRTCVDNCPAKRSWLCQNAKNVTTCLQSNVTTSNSSSSRCSPLFGFCIGENAKNVSALLQWITTQLSFRQFGLIVSYQYMAATLATVATVTVVANVSLGVMMNCCNFKWIAWTIFIGLSSAGAIGSLGCILVFDVYNLQQRFSRNTAPLTNSTLTNSTTAYHDVDVPFWLSALDSGSIWFLLLSTILFTVSLLVVPIAAIIWTAVLRSAFDYSAILRAVKEHLVSRTTMARIQAFTFINSLTIVLFQLLMLLVVYSMCATLDEFFSIGIFSKTPNGTSSQGAQLLITGVMIIWGILWIVMSEALVSLHYENVTAHIWHHFYERNSTMKPYREHFCDLRSCLSVYQCGVAMHGAFWLFSRMGRLLWFALTTLCRGSATSMKLSESIFCVSSYFSGIGFSRSANIYEQLLNVDEKVADDELNYDDTNIDTATTYSAITTNSDITISTGSVRYVLPPNEVDEHTVKLKLTEQQLMDLQTSISELEKKIAELRQLESEQYKKKTQIKVVRDLSNEKEKSLSDKEAQVRYVLNTLLGEFEKTKRELSESLDRQRVFEIKKMTNPPDAVKLTIEAVACLIGERELDWNSLRVFIVKDSFLPSVMRLEAETVSIDACRDVRQRYFTNKLFTYDKTQHASRTCGTLYRWLDALTAFALERDRIKPMLSEVEKLTAELERLRAEDRNLKLQVAEQDAAIAGTRLQMQRLKRQLSRLRGEEQSLHDDKSNIEKLAMEALNREPPEPSITIETHFEEKPTDLADIVSADQRLREKRAAIQGMLRFNWTISCFCYSILLSLCILSFPLARAFLALFVDSETKLRMATFHLPCFYAVSLLMAFCLIFPVCSTVVATFEAIIHTCVVAALFYLNGDILLPSGHDKSTKNELQKKIPKHIDYFITKVAVAQTSEQ